MSNLTGFLGGLITLIENYRNIYKKFTDEEKSFAIKFCDEELKGFIVSQYPFLETETQNEIGEQLVNIYEKLEKELDEKEQLILFQSLNEKSKNILTENGKSPFQKLIKISEKLGPEQKVIFFECCNNEMKDYIKKYHPEIEKLKAEVYV